MMPVAVKDMTGQRVGRWLVIGFSHIKGGHARWYCRCDCGTEKDNIRGSDLRSGLSQSCGCLVREKLLAANLKHGQSEGRNQKATPEYVAWTSMISRCENEKHSGFKRYGGRGIKVCRRWRNSFPAFLADMGLKPSPKHSLDRYPNNDGNYAPNNCRWATAKEQANNRRNPWLTRRKQSNGL